MIIFTPTELEQQGIVWRAATTLALKDKQFAKGGSFSKRIFQQVVSQLQQEQLADGAEFLILDMGEHFTVWHEAPAPTAAIAPSATANSSLDQKDQPLQPADRSLEAPIPSDQLNSSEAEQSIDPVPSPEFAQPTRTVQQPSPKRTYKMIYRGAKYDKPTA